jgi:periplasmic protein TonB
MGEVRMRCKKTGPEELKSAESSAQVEKSSHENFGLSALTSCLVDADGDRSSGAGRARRKALGVSALVQFCTLMALLIVPLFATGTRLIIHAMNFVPLPPYGGAPKQAPANNQRVQPPPLGHPSIDPFPVTRQIQTPTRPATNNDLREVVDLSLGITTSSNSDAIPGGAGPVGPGNLLRGYSNTSGPQPPPPEPAPALVSRKPIVVSQGVQLALLVHRVEPIYPSFARLSHREGTVELRAIISSDGVVRDVQVLSGDPVLAQSAREAVAQWRFRPTMLNGVAVEVITFVTVKFHMDQ